ncbi:MAG: hypothetical protein ACEPOV_02405 [Hyphomicrobiales bacterium]
MRYLISGLLFFFFFNAYAQIEDVELKMVDDPKATRELFARTKQVSQFFRRFNNEEDQFGKGYSIKDTNYRNNRLRDKTLGLLFDKEGFFSEDLKKMFIKQVTNPKAPFFLDFHKGNWYAEVSAQFSWKGEDRNIILFLKIEKSRKGYKWVLTNVFFEEFQNLFTETPDEDKHFLHPLSHELDFIPLNKAFRDISHIQSYASDGHNIDYLSLFFYELKLGNLVFQTLDQVKFHFFQVPNWYFELSYVNRKGYNAGWLITNLQYITKEQQKALLKLYEP